MTADDDGTPVHVEHRGAPPHRRLPVVAAVVVGFLTALQSRVNGQLSSVLHNGIQAAVVSFGSGLLILTALVLTVRPMRAGLQRLPEAVRSGRLRPWQLFGGVLGGFFVAVQSITVPLVGVAVFTVAIVAGQSGNSLVVDRIGLGPAGPQSVTPRRVVAAGIAVVAVGIAVSDRLGGSSFSPLAVLMALVAGMGIAVQQAINGRVGAATRNAFSATWVNFATGATALVTALLVGSLLSSSAPAALPPSPWWLYTGGAIGILFIATAAWVVGVLGVLLFALLSIAGQLSGALVLDLLAPTPGTNLGWHLVAGALLTFVAVVMAAVRR